MAKLKVFTLDNLTLYDELIKGYIDAADAAVDAKSLKTVAITGNTLKFYNVAEPVGETAPVYSIELPQTDLTDVLTRLSALEDGKADKSSVYTKDEVDSAIEASEYDDTQVKADIKANTDAIAAINNAETGIFAQSKEYTNTTVANAVADVKSSLASALTYKGQKATEDELPTEGNVCGDVWNVTTTDKGTSAEFVWVVDNAETGAGHWEELGTALDLSAYAEKEQVATDIATAKGEAVSEAKTYADGLNTAMDTRVKTVEDAIGENGSVTNAIADAKKAGTDASAAVKALEEGQVKTNTDAIAKNAEDIVALQSTLGEGVEAITEDEINALFA